MKKVSIIGHFGADGVFGGGQSVKTVTITRELANAFGDNEVVCFKTQGWKKDLLISPFYTMKALARSRNVIILPAQNGLRVFAPLLVIGNVFFRRTLHYAVIGGWLPAVIEKKRLLAAALKRFDYIYVETSTMKAALEKQGFTNIVIMPNCKDLKILDGSGLVYPSGEPYKLCTFSRVMREKGIEDAVNAVKAVNQQFGRIVCTLDVYGQIDAAQTAWFDELQKSFPPYIRYGGLIPFEKSVDVVKEHFALLFPTRFFTEGIPGTILDAYAAGVPVIASKWESFADVVDDGVTGIGISFNDAHALAEQLAAAVEHPQQINEMKEACLIKARSYLPRIGLSVLINHI